MGYINPLLELPAGRALRALPAEDRKRIELVMRELRAHADELAETAHRRRKGPMYAYWRAVATYSRHVAHALSKGGPSATNSIAARAHGTCAAAAFHEETQ